MKYIPTIQLTVVHEILGNPWQHPAQIFFYSLTHQKLVNQKSKSLAHICVILQYIRNMMQNQIKLKT